MTKNISRRSLFSIVAGVGASVALPAIQSPVPAAPALWPPFTRAEVVAILDRARATIRESELLSEAIDARMLGEGTLTRLWIPLIDF